MTKHAKVTVNNLVQITCLLVIMVMWVLVGMYYGDLVFKWLT